MPVIYNSRHLIPGPFVQINRRIERTPDGVARQRGWVIVAKGTLVATRGSPDRSFNESSDNPLDWFYDGSYDPFNNVGPADPPLNLQDADDRLRRMLYKVQALHTLFDEDGKWFEVYGFDDRPPVKFQPRVTEIEVAEGTWATKAEYTVTMEAECLYYDEQELCAFVPAENLPEETWQLEQADDLGRTYRLTHTVSAHATRKYRADGSVEKEGWEVARDLVLITSGSKLGFERDKLDAALVLGLTSFQPYNRARQQTIDEPQGKFTVQETWLCFNPADHFGDATAGAAIEELNVDTRYSNDSGLFSVSVAGTVTGLEERDPNTDAVTVTRWENAQLRFAQITDAVVLARAQSLSGVPLNPAPLGSSVGRNQRTGVITYNVEFDNRLGVSDPAYLSEVYTYSFENAADVFASIGVINRLAGPILQPIGSTTQKSVTVTGDIVVRVAYGSPEPSAPSYNPLTKVAPYIAGAVQVFLAKDSPTWVPRHGRYSRSTTFVYQ